MPGQSGSCNTTKKQREDAGRIGPEEWGREMGRAIVLGCCAGLLLHVDCSSDNKGLLQTGKRPKRKIFDYPQRFPLAALIQLKSDWAGDAGARLYPVRRHATRRYTFSSTCHYTFSLYCILLINKMFCFCKNVRCSDLPQNTAFWDAPYIL